MERKKRRSDVIIYLPWVIFCQFEELKGYLRVRKGGGGSVLLLFVDFNAAVGRGPDAPSPESALPSEEGGSREPSRGGEAIGIQSGPGLQPMNVGLKSWVGGEEEGLA